MKNKPIILLSICLAFLLVSSQAFGKKPGMPSEEEVPETETPYGGEYGKKESKPKSPDLEITKKNTRVSIHSFSKKYNGCEYQVDTTVKNIGNKTSAATTLHVTKSPSSTNIKKEKILALKKGKSSDKRHVGKNPDVLPKGTTEFTFKVDPVADEPTDKRANNSHVFNCSCPASKKICKKIK